MKLGRQSDEEAGGRQDALNRSLTLIIIRAIPTMGQTGAATRPGPGRCTPEGLRSRLKDK